MSIYSWREILLFFSKTNNKWYYLLFALADVDFVFPFHSSFFLSLHVENWLSSVFLSIKKVIKKQEWTSCMKPNEELLHHFCLFAFVPALDGPRPGNKVSVMDVGCGAKAINEIYCFRAKSAGDDREKMLLPLTLSDRITPNCPWNWFCTESTSIFITLLNLSRCAVVLLIISLNLTIRKSEREDLRCSPYLFDSQETSVRMFGCNVGLLHLIIQYFFSVLFHSTR